MSFEGKTVLVTGGSSGIGRAAAGQFGSAGAQVFVTGRDQTRGREVVDTLPNSLSSSPSASEDRWSPEDLEDLEDLDLAIDEDLFARTDQLLAAHRALARVDRSSAAATAVALDQVEEQLAILTERHATVEARLQQIRLVILRRYRQEAAPARDQPA